MEKKIPWLGGKHTSMNYIIIPKYDHKENIKNEKTMNLNKTREISEII